MNPQSNEPTNVPPMSTPPVDLLQNPGHHRKIGPIIVILVVIILVVIGLLYVFAPKNNSETSELANIPAMMEDMTNVPSTTPATIAPVTNKADDLQSLQKDLNMSTEGLDTQSI